MELSEEDRNYILNQYLATIYDISNKEYQKRVWIRGEGPEVDDFDETVCRFFEDGDPILKKYKEYNISQEQYLVLIQFRSAFDSFLQAPSPYLEKEFIDTPEWANIMEQAKEVLEAFHYQKE